MKRPAGLVDLETETKLSAIELPEKVVKREKPKVTSAQVVNKEQESTRPKTFTITDRQYQYLFNRASQQRITEGRNVGASEVLRDIINAEMNKDLK